VSGQIKIAFRNRDEPIEDVALNARELEGDDARVAREIAITAALDGCRTAGDLLRRVERSTPAGRRRMLDDARAAVGLPTVADAEARAKFEAANNTGVLRARQRRRATLRLDPSGAIVEVDEDEVERERHRDAKLAAEREERRKRREAEAEAIRRARERYDRENTDNDFGNPPLAGIPHVRLGSR
jgi:hypothetical protein